MAIKVFNTTHATILICLISIFVTSVTADLPRTFLRGSRKLKADQAAAIISSRGFKAEVYSVLVGHYTVGLYRIINPLADPKTLYKYPVLQSHGVFFDATNMIINSNSTTARKPEIGKINIESERGDLGDTSFPFTLSNNNFDVWLCDMRGSDEERSQQDIERQNLTSNEYWDFNLDNEAQEDLPTAIDFVLTKTNAQKVIYFGYSESTTFMFMLLAERPEFMSKIAAYIGLAPIAYLSHLKGLSTALELSHLVPHSVNLNALPSPLQLAADTSIAGLCAISAANPITCKAIIDMVGGPGSSDYAPSFFKRFIKPTSLNAFRQFIQIHDAQTFQHYDFGHPESNMVAYNSPRPPLYYLNRIPANRLIFARGGSDFLSTPPDQERLVFELDGKLFADFKIPQYNHFDFLYGQKITKNVIEPVTRALFNLLLKYEEPLIRDPSQVDNPEIVPDDVIMPAKHSIETLWTAQNPSSPGLIKNLITKPVDFLRLSLDHMFR